jgi:hypothetical protein
LWNNDNKSSCEHYWGKGKTKLRYIKKKQLTLNIINVILGRWLHSLLMETVNGVMSYGVKRHFQPVLLVEETGVLEDNHRPAASHWQT